MNTAGLEEGDYLVRVRATDGVNTAEDISDGMFSIKLVIGVSIIALVLMRKLKK